MAVIRVPAADAQFHARRAEHDAAPWIEWLARLGYAAKGLVYMVIGGIAVQAAVGRGDRVTGSEGALESVARQPFGRVLLAVVALGLVGYALWKLVQAIRDPEHKGGDAKGNAARVGFGISGLVHAGLALEAGRLVLGSGMGDGSESGADNRTAMLMEQPFGRWLVALVGLGILGFGLYELYRAYKEDVAKRMHLLGLDSDTRHWVIRSGRFGYAARGVVFGLIGFFLIQAALHYNPSEARGLGGALHALQGESYGPYLLGTVALGLIAYGIFAMVKARYRRIQPAA